MKVGAYLWVTAALLFGCGGEEDTGFTSLIGLWTYTTPDGKMKVEFDIVGGDKDLLAVKNQKIFVDGEEGRAEAQTEAITETTLGSLRINANDAGLVWPYSITFTNLSASDDFSTIKVEEAKYIFPWPDSNSLSQIEITRR
ncbi:MAG TPA: hypothetical protein PKW06_03995 [Cyclobacteriaceae bacterium]|nr:hypothetical protein [Cyclobacteriaceae bacterium]MCB9239414.1 hypothetical protein [Flammeovirgaceae bacterium]MCB0499661.1 hypothetical protein [Cyclobacteriaceae bacterium]MCO5271203.1 hypothetical protein [Cyclobacteriaceae bacterium]MCW5902591.1 hypothetical protein [Cyclobacteriaceae bacterium]